MPPEIRQFLEDLINDAGYTALTDEVKEEILQDLFLRLDSSLMASALEHLPEVHLQGFNELVDNNEEPVKIHEYLKRTVPDINKVFMDALIDFRRSYLQGAQSVSTVQ